ncbi:DNA-directed RNA polymerase subunit omega [Trichlorobacter ammonificans]|uniref:DNA-directed RNA polymerase subunit omega n=1 Tax=Trichlorobacter ammonificans TaxID=2916410 RepID=A0ABN8HJ09_9BACT|nr:DNA-directed RNA polymerase subunit omega [Trichlorobacter ammonificans]CAH2031313.1 DNA-directed RNA polymerase subunit omega [Trichlorobacter ammonificans]
MARVTVEDCLQQINNRFMLVMMTSKRVKQLYKGAPPLIDRKNNRYVVTALREIAAGKLSAEFTSRRSA